MIIDIDEAALFLESSNRGRGKAHLIRRCREVGPYGHSEKLNILVAISGEDATPANSSRRWVETWHQGGTTNDRFTAFIRRILQDIGQGTPQHWYCFTMDNLNTHRNLIIMQMIHAAGHRCVFRAPYYPFDSAIEHVFNSFPAIGFRGRFAQELAHAKSKGYPSPVQILRRNSTNFYGNSGANADRSIELKNIRRPHHRQADRQP
eukprot:scaffold1870_cov73-Cyclotella_meneghiniana.AAC.5